MWASALVIALMWSASLPLNSAAPGCSARGFDVLGVGVYIVICHAFTWSKVSSVAVIGAFSSPMLHCKGHLNLLCILNSFTEIIALTCKMIIDVDNLTVRNYCKPKEMALMCNDFLLMYVYMSYIYM